jgi:hypothetical protein
VLGRGEARGVSDGTQDPPEFRVRIDNTDSPVAEGETLTVRPTVTNRGDREGTQQVELSINGTGVVDTRVLTLGGSESEQIALSWDTASGDTGNYTATVASENDTDTAPVTVLEPAFFEVTVNGTNSPVEGGENLTVNATVENTGEDPDSQAIELNISGLGEPFAAERVGLYGGNSTQVTLTNVTEGDDVGEYTAVVASEDDSDSVMVQITGRPVVTSIIVESAPVNYTDAGGNGRNVTVTYSEAMNESVDPTVELRNVSADDSIADAGWTANDTYVARTDIEQNEEDVVATVNVTGAEDTDGNVQTPTEETFFVDTDRPGDVQDVTAKPNIVAANETAVTYGIKNPSALDGDEDIRVTLTGPNGATVTNRTPAQGGGGDTTRVTFNASSLSDGSSVSIEAVAIDDLNNTGATLSESGIVKDTIPPSIDRFEATGQGNTFTVTIEATEANSINQDGVELNVTPQDPGNSVRSSTVNTFDNSGDSFTYEVEYNVDPGDYTIELVELADQYGNDGASGQSKNVSTQGGKGGGPPDNPGNAP